MEIGKGFFNVSEFITSYPDEQQIIIYSASGQYLVFKGTRYLLENCGNSVLLSKLVISSALIDDDVIIYIY